MSLVPYVHVDTTLDDARDGDLVALTAGEEHHLRRVLRLPEGAPVEVADGRGNRAHARLDGEALVLVGTIEHHPTQRPHLWVAQAMPKGRKVDEVIRQVSELGVDGITIVAAERSVSRIDASKAERVRRRWADVARAACAQARRPWRPRIAGPVPTTSLADGAGVLLVAHPDGQPLPEVVVAHEAAERVTVAIGPEGGWSQGEISVLLAAGASLVGLGPTVLRTEHAAAAALAVVAANLGRWRTCRG
jgi:16S rRNA (uracil1498-N3)-methyltransferase